ncbi:P-loop containing nucleoside triphosphate hydrolase protein [Mycena amicta]|nr:P-loop containing nucleoside triphosphate hydrolase protein [Mycena amicta]
MLAVRLILDEAHYIRNRAGKIHAAIYEVQAEIRWALTATPIINNLRDLGALVHVLRTCEPLDDPADWDTHVGTGLQQGSGHISVVKQLLQAICLRRTKQMKNADGRPLLLLPNVNYQTLEVVLSPKQRALYDEIEGSGKATLTTNNNAMKILTVILRLRQLVLHPTLVPKSGDLANVCFGCTAELSGNQEDPEEQSITSCREGHKLCSECSTQALCPCGAKHASRDRSTTTPSGKAGAQDEEVDINAYDLMPGVSVKVDALILLLKGVPLQDKILVFSSFVQFLKILAKRLSKEQISHALYHGGITGTNREKIVERFSVPLQQEPTSPRILLTSLHAGAFGLNLTVANHVFLMDPWWQPSIERQAIDRVNRLGQTKIVSVIRFVAKDTVEQRVLRIQAEKAELIRQALSETSNGAGASDVATQIALQRRRDQNAQKSTSIRQALGL